MFNSPPLSFTSLGHSFHIFLFPSLVSHLKSPSCSLLTAGRTSTTIWSSSRITPQSSSPRCHWLISMLFQLPETAAQFLLLRMMNMLPASRCIHPHVWGSHDHMKKRRILLRMKKNMFVFIHYTIFSTLFYFTKVYLTFEWKMIIKEMLMSNAKSVLLINKNENMMHKQLCIAHRLSPCPYFPCQLHLIQAELKINRIL